jgi:hypothetical protein
MANGNLVFNPDNISITHGETIHLVNNIIPLLS